jgi:glutaredoxin
MPTNSSVVYSQPNCIGCKAAKNILTERGFVVEERNIADSAEYKQELFSAVPSAKSVPQVFVNGQYIGGLTELRAFLLA